MSGGENEREKSFRRKIPIQTSREKRTDGGEGEGIVEVDELIQPLVQHHCANRREVPTTRQTSMDVSGDGAEAERRGWVRAPAHSRRRALLRRGKNGCAARGDVTHHRTMQTPARKESRSNPNRSAGMMASFSSDFICARYSLGGARETCAYRGVGRSLFITSSTRCR